MNVFVAVILTQDAVTGGAIYTLVAIALVMVFSVTRVILVPQGEFVSFAALTLASLQAGVVPGTVWLLVIGGLAVAALDVAALVLGQRPRRRLSSAAVYGIGPVAVAAVAAAARGPGVPAAAQVFSALLVVAPLGPILYRLAFAPLASASVLVLLMTAVAVHFVLVGLGLLAFGPEGVRSPPLFSDQLVLGNIALNQQVVFVVGVTTALMIAMALFFDRTLSGKALRATAMNQTGARIVGIRSASAGTLAFGLAGIVGAVSGVLIAPLTTIYYDTGFLIGLKGFMAAIVGALASYPLAAVSALGIGFFETFSSFYASAYKEAIVFALIIPILLWRSFGADHANEDGE